MRWDNKKQRGKLCWFVSTFIQLRGPPTEWNLEIFPRSATRARFLRSLQTIVVATRESA